MKKKQRRRQTRGKQSPATSAQAADGPPGAIELPKPFLPFIAPADLLRADSVADMAKHAIVRMALMNALVNDQRVLAVFDDWSRHTGIGELAATTAEMADRVAGAIGVEGRAQLFVEGSDGLPGADSKDVEQVRRNLLTIGERSIRHDGRSLLAILTLLAVRELDLPWAFVPFELHRAYCLLVDGHVTGQISELVVHAAPFPDVEAYDAARRQAANALIRETDDDPRAMAAVVFRDLMQRFDELDAQAPKGRAPKHGGSHLEDYARWFYRHRVCGESTYHLAKEYSAARLGPTADVDDHPTILRGIAEAKKWLDLAEYQFRVES